MTRVAVNPDLLLWARERARLDVDDLTAKFPKYEAWEQGDVQPTLRQLEDFAKTTATPFGYFFLETRPEEKLPVTDYRTIRDQPLGRPSPDLMQTIRMMERRQDWMRDYLEEEGGEPLSFVGSATPSDEPAEVARDIRNVLGISDGWAKELTKWDEARGALRQWIEDAGILAFINGIVGNDTHRALDEKEFRGFVLVDKYAPLIFVNGADSKSAQVFTLAHELAHVWIGQSSLFDMPHLQPGASEIEQFCNTVAAEFLVPTVEFDAAWSRVKQKDNRFELLARQFKVSPIVAARRALDRQHISRHEFFDFYNGYMDVFEYTSKDSKSSGGNFWHNQPYRAGRAFAESVILAARAGKLLYRDAFALLGLKAKSFDTYARKLGV